MPLLELLEANATALLFWALTGLALLGAGYATKGPRSHDLRIAGWIVFGLYWPTQAPHFFLEVPADPVNGWFCLFAPLGAAYLAWHELRSRRWGEDPVALRWLAGTVFVAATTYFLIYQVPFITDALIHFTTWQSAIVTSVVFGVDASYARGPTGDWNIYINGGEYAVTVILACTAIQSIMIFVGAIACIDAPRKAKWKALAASVIPIYTLNLLRNASIVWGYKVLQWNPFAWGGPKPEGWRGMFWRELAYPDGTFVGLSTGSFEFIHGFVAKAGSLVALVVIALAVFTILPELHGAILDVFDLRKRKRPGFFQPPGGGPASAPKADAPATAPGTGAEPAAGAK